MCTIMHQGLDRRSRNEFQVILVAGPAIMARLMLEIGARVFPNTSASDSSCVRTEILQESSADTVAVFHERVLLNRPCFVGQR